MRFIVFSVMLMAANATAGSEFALRESCPSTNPKQQTPQCLLGEMPKGTKLLLLGTETSATCVTSVVDSTELQDPSQGKIFPLMVLDSENCANFGFILAHTNPEYEKSYKRHALQRLEDQTIIKKVDGVVRAKLSYIESTEGEHRTALSATLPVVYGIPGKENVYIASLNNSLIPGGVTHVLYANGVLSKIHGDASIVSMFTLAKRVFVHYKFTCSIGCGYRGDFIIEVTEKGFSMVFFDDSSSA